MCLANTRRSRDDKWGTGYSLVKIKARSDSGPVVMKILNKSFVKPNRNVRV